MDDKEEQAAAEDSCLTSCFKCFGGCACFGATATLCYYLAIYRFDNPDPQAYYIDGTTPRLVAYADENDENVVPIHQDFMKWFTLMLFNAFAAICGVGVILPIATYMVYLNATCGRWCDDWFDTGFSILCMHLSCCWLMVWILGLTIRFSEAGRFSSGDHSESVDDELDGLYQVHNAKFLSVFYLLSFMFIGVLCLIGTISACKSSNEKTNDSSYEKADNLSQPKK